MDGNYGIENVGVQKREVGKVAVMDFDMNVVVLGCLPGQVDLALVGVDRNDPCALLGQRNGAVSSAAAKVENPHSRKVAEEFAVEAFDIAGAKLDR